MKVLTGTTNIMLSERLSFCLNAPFVAREIKRFPDKEAYVRILDDVEGEHIIVVQSTYPDEKIVELFLMIDALQELGPSKITLVIPYFGYARQDRIFKPGEALSARAAARRIEMGVDEVLMINLHKSYITEYFSSAKAYNLSVMPDIGRYLLSLKAEVILSPDRGALPYAKEAGEAAGLPFDNLNKKRIDSERVVIEPSGINPNGKIIGIVDDIISTGGTIMTAAEHLKKAGAREVIVGAVHGLFNRNVQKRFEEINLNVSVTDTIQTPLSNITAAETVCRWFLGG